MVVVAAGYLNNRSELRGINWAAYVRGEDRAGFEAWVRRRGPPDFTIREPGPDGNVLPSEQHDDYFPLVYTSPASNAAALGRDFLRYPARLAPVRADRRPGRVVQVDRRE